MPIKKENSGSLLELGTRSAGTAFSVFLGKLVSLISGAFMLIFISRYIGPQQYGIYVVAIAVAGFMSSFGSLNIGYYFNKIIPKLKARNESNKIGMLLGDSLAFLLLAAIVLIGIGIVLSPLIARYTLGSYSYSIYIFAAVFSIIWFMLYPDLNTTLISVGSRKDVAIAAMSGTFFQAVFSVALVLLGLGALGPLLGYFMGFLLASLITIYLINSNIKIRFNAKGMFARIRKMLSFTFPITLSGIISSNVSNFSVIFLGILLVSTSLIGQFGVAQRVGVIITLISSSITAVLVAMFSTAMQETRNRRKLSLLYTSSIFYILLFTVPMIVYTVVLSHQIVVTVFTAAYSQTAFYMPLISVGFLIQSVGFGAGELLISLGKVKRILRLTIYISALELASILILGPIFKVLGIIAAVFYIGSIAYVYLYMREIRKSGIRFEIGPTSRLIIANLILGAAMLPLLLLQIRPLYIMAMGIVEILAVYPIILSKSGAMSIDELNLLYRAGEKIPVLDKISKWYLDYVRILM